MNRFIILAAAFLLLAGTAEARKVSGVVKSGEEKLGGVIITDGKNFTQTKKNGKFSFEIEDDAEFVYVVTPAGYVADWSSGVPAFYQRAEGKKKFEFDLIPVSESADYSIIAVADPQVADDEQFEKFVGYQMDDIRATISGLKDLTIGLALGDITDDKFHLLERYKEEIVRSGIPFYPVIGNHDHELQQVGDAPAAAKYRSLMGPENYAFFLGKELVLVLDNIVYDTKYKYTAAYADHVLTWVGRLMKYVPKGMDVYVAQHSPAKRWETGKKLAGMSDLLSLLRGRKVTFISGHAHTNNNLDYGNNATEHNVAAISGTWFDTMLCTDGTPAGYKVFTMKGGKLEWYYKTLEQPKDYQMEFYGMGQTLMHPNSIVLNIWDWSSEWKVEWFEDGKPMGKLKPVMEHSPAHIRAMSALYKGKKVPFWKRSSLNYHYFAATPHGDAKTVAIVVENPFGQRWVHTADLSDYVSVQAHISGLTPENMEEKVKGLLDIGVNALEFEVYVSPDGAVEVAKGVSVGDFIDFAEKYAKEKGYSPVRYSADLKSWKGRGEGQDRATYDNFATDACKLLNSRYLDDRLVVGSRDYRILNYINVKYPELVLSYIVDAEEFDFEKSLKKLKFTPQYLSPESSLVNDELIEKCKAKGLLLAPRGVDSPETITRILSVKPAAIITSTPEEAIMQNRGFVVPKKHY